MGSLRRKYRAFAPQLLHYLLHQFRLFFGLSTALAVEFASALSGNSGQRLLGHLRHIGNSWPIQSVWPGAIGQGTSGLGEDESQLISSAHAGRALVITTLHMLFQYLGLVREVLAPTIHASLDISRAGQIAKI